MSEWSQRKAWNNDGMDPDWRPSPPPAPVDPVEKIAAWLEGLSRRADCPQERKYWYEGVAADIRGGVWKQS